jgi:transposase InsO family protein
MEITSIDISGTYPITWFPEAVQVPNQEAESVARALVTQVFTRHGCPQVLSSDRWTNFMSTLFQEMCKLLQIKRITSTAINQKIQVKNREVPRGAKSNHVIT